jgi:hypothetical protein
VIPILILATTVLLACVGVVMATRSVTRVEKRGARCEEELAAMRRHPCNHPAGAAPDTAGKDSGK